MFVIASIALKVFSGFPHTKRERLLYRLLFPQTGKRFLGKTKKPWPEHGYLPYKSFSATGPSRRHGVKEWGVSSALYRTTDGIGSTFPFCPPAVHRYGEGRLFESSPSTKGRSIKWPRPFGPQPNSPFISFLPFYPSGIWELKPEICIYYKVCLP